MGALNVYGAMVQLKTHDLKMICTKLCSQWQQLRGQSVIFFELYRV